MNKKKIIYGTYICLMCVLFVMSIVGMIFTKIGSDDAKNVTRIENTTLEYSITLNDGSVYTHKDELAFVPNMVKSIKVKLNYHNDYENYKDYKLSTDAILYVKPGAQKDEITKYAFLSREIIRDSKVNEKDTEINVDIDYQKYLTKLNDYVNKNSLNEKTIGKLELVTISENNTTGVSNKSVVEISFLEEAMEIYASKVIYNYNSTTLGNNVNKIKLATLLSIVLFVGICVCFFFYNKLSKMSSYDRFMYKVLRLNKGILVESDLTNMECENMILVNSFKELLKVQSCISLPIVYNKDSKGCKFLIKVNNGGYYYIINKE